MAVTRTVAPGPEQLSQQIDNIIKSHSLRGSESLCKLLQYLAKQSLDHPEAPLKEYQIATEVYGRSADFDPQADSTIRVQAGRLRMKLAEYYTTEGAADPILVRIPKGSYHLIFEARVAAGNSADSGTQLLSVPRQEAQREVTVEVVPARWRVAVILLAACLLAALMALGTVWNRRSDSAAAKVSVARPTGPLADFWRPFASGPEEPWVIFSNAAFVGRPETGLRYYDAQHDAKTQVHDHYAGVGEVLAIHALDDAFHTLGRTIRVKRGSLFSLDDAKSTNLIFVGSPSENLSLLDIPGTQEFVFQRLESGPRKGDLAIVSRHPKADEAGTYLASPSNLPITEDYAIIGRCWNRLRRTGHDSGRNDHVRDPSGGGICVPPGVSRKIAPRDARPERGSDETVRSTGSDEIVRGVPVDTELVAMRAR